MVDRLRAGEEIDVSDLRDALPPFFRQVAHAGGLLHYGNRWLAGSRNPGTTPTCPSGR